MKDILIRNKTTIAGILIAVAAFLKARNIIDTDTTLLITAVLGATGLAVAKDNNVHSTSAQIQKADKEKALEKKKIIYSGDDY